MNSAPRELKVTIICATCEHQYGTWRPRCPTCGTTTPASATRDTFNNAPRLRRVKTRSPHECIFCRLRGARKDKCPHCGEPIHRSCLRLHKADCAKFQEELNTAARALAETAK